MNEPKLRFKADDGSDYLDLVEIKIGDAIKEAKRPLDMEDDEKYQLVTVKRRNEGIVSRGMFYGRDILVKNYYTVKKGDYIISKRQVIHGANGIVPPELDDAIVSNEYMVLSDSNTLLVDYLALYSMTKKMYHMFYISSYGVDIEKMFFNVDDWKKKKIMVPCVKEQQKIADFLSTIDTVIAKQKETVSAWEERKKGVMQKLFSQEVRFKADDGSDFPEWEEKKIGDLFYKVNERNNGQFGKDKWISVAKMYYQDEDKVTSNNIDTRTYVMRVGDMSFEGHPNKEFKYGRFVVNDIGDGIISELFPIYRHKENYILKYWKYAIQVDSIMQKIYRKSITSSGASSNKLDDDDFKRQSISVPCLEEQQKIADCLSSLDEVIEKQKATLAAWEALKKGLLQQMFV